MYNFYFDPPPHSTKVGVGGKCVSSPAELKPTTVLFAKVEHEGLR